MSQCTITIDFDELHKLTHATEEAGFDPYTQYLKIMSSQRNLAKFKELTGSQKDLHEVTLDKMIDRLIKGRKKLVKKRP